MSLESQCIKYGERLDDLLKDIEDSPQIHLSVMGELSLFLFFYLLLVFYDLGRQTRVWARYTLKRPDRAVLKRLRATKYEVEPVDDLYFIVLPK